MSSQFHDLMAETGFPQLREQLGESVTRYASGTGGGTTVTAIVSDINGGGEEIETTNGLMRVRVKALQVAASQTVTIDDHWAIGGERWKTIAVDGAHDGLRSVTVRRTDRARQEQAPGRGG